MSVKYKKFMNTNKGTNLKKVHEYKNVCKIVKSSQIWKKKVHEYKKVQKFE